MPELLRVGPEGLLLLHGMIISVLLAFLTWRRVPLGRAALVTMAAAFAVVAWEFLAFRGEVNHPILTMLFVIVPSALLFWASRASWAARRAWVLAVLGPFAFVACYVGICTCYFRVFGVPGV